MDITDMIRLAMEQYFDGTKAPFANSPLGNLFRKEIPESLIDKAKIDEEQYLVKGSIGVSRYAQIPWVALMDKEITDSVQRGVVLMLLFSADKETVYLSLNQGYTFFLDRFGTADARKKLREISAIIRESFETSNKKVQSDIDLNSDQLYGQGYEAGNIWAISYNVHDFPGEFEFLTDLQNMIYLYQSVRSLIGHRTIEEFYEYLLMEQSGYVNTITVDKEVTTETVSRYFNASLVFDTPVEKTKPVKDVYGNIVYPRDVNISCNALSFSDFKCDVDSSHFTFLNSRNHLMYVKAHHLIDMKYADDFDYSLDVEANICSLCSVCYDRLRHASLEDKKEILEKLYEARKERLKDAGIEISFEKLLDYYK